MSLATEQASELPTRTIAQVDNDFEQIGCLGHGGFGSVFLAKKKSGRRVALKFIHLDEDDEDPYDCFTRELESVTKLHDDDDKQAQDVRSNSIVYFEDWFTGSYLNGSPFACIIMSYADGGTLSQEIASKSEPYTERRIAWYALQLSEALAYAHERGVAHHDVKSSNVLIEWSGGGRLQLCDFGSAVAPGEESVGFSEIYASPELIAAHAQDDYTCLEADKTDAYGLGCILFELLCCQKLVDLTGDQTLAEFIRDNGSEAALNLPCVRLPWLPPEETAVSKETVGYSNALQSLVVTLLEPQSKRWRPCDLQNPLRRDPLSPLLAKRVLASHALIPGAPVTIDNVQLGVFVQRGPDWEEGDVDGGAGSIGVVVKLDPDALYTTVVWPSRSLSTPLEPVCCRIGANQKFELQAGPTPLANFYNGVGESMSTGLVLTRDVSKHSVGQQLNSNCLVVGVEPDDNLIFVAPQEKIAIPAIAASAASPPANPSCYPRKPQTIPKHWEPEKGTLVEVTDVQEKSNILEVFHSIEGGMGIQAYEVTSIKRVQCDELWKAYALAREDVAAEFWGIKNEKQLFHGTGSRSPDSLLQNWSEFYRSCSSSGDDFSSQKIVFSTRASWADENRHQAAAGEWQVVLSRVTLGRVLDKRFDSTVETAPSLTYHSEHTLLARPFNQIELFSIHNAAQAYPDYIITYKPLYLQGRRIVSARRPFGVNGGPPVPSGPRSQSASARRVEGVRNAALTGRAAGVCPQPQNVAASSHGSSALALSTPTEVPDETSKMTKQSKEKLLASPTKLCVVCLGKPVCRILLPCGHPCLCEICSTAQGLSKLRHKCPECRKTIREAATIYGRVVNG